MASVTDDSCTACTGGAAADCSAATCAGGYHTYASGACSPCTCSDGVASTTATVCDASQDSCSSCDAGFWLSGTADDASTCEACTRQTGCTTDDTGVACVDGLKTGAVADEYVCTLAAAGYYIDGSNVVQKYMTCADDPCLDSADVGVPFKECVDVTDSDRVCLCAGVNNTYDETTGCPYPNCTANGHADCPDSYCWLDGDGSLKCDIDCSYILSNPCDSFDGDCCTAAIRESCGVFNPTGSCPELSCVDAPELMNSDGSEADCNGTLSGGGCNVTCMSPYELTGPSTIICRNATWDYASCDEPGCDVPAAITESTGSEADCNWTMSGDSCDVVCNSGYAPSGALVCRNGTWDAVTCDDIDACVGNPCDANAACTDTAGGAAGAAGRACACNTGYTGDGEVGNCAVPTSATLSSAASTTATTATTDTTPAATTAAATGDAVVSEATTDSDTPLTSEGWFLAVVILGGVCCCAIIFGAVFMASKGGKKTADDFSFYEQTTPDIPMRSDLA